MLIIFEFSLFFQFIGLPKFGIGKIGKNMFEFGNKSSDLYRIFQYSKNLKYYELKLSILGIQVAINGFKAASYFS